jgi:hypothetical protein
MERDACLLRALRSVVYRVRICVVVLGQSAAREFVLREKGDRCFRGGGYFGAGLHEACVIPLVWNCLLV